MDLETEETILFELQLHFVHASLCRNGGHGLNNVWSSNGISNYAEFAQAILGIQSSCLDYG